MKQTFARMALIALAATFCAAPVSAQPGQRLLVIKASGDRGWSLSCTFNRPDDDKPVKWTARGRGDVETFSDANVSGGECRYEGPRRGAMLIRFTDERDASRCPLAKVEENCLGSVAAGESGTFSF